MGTGTTFEMNDTNLENFKATLRMFPESTKQAVAQCLNDEARLFKELGPKVIGQKYAIRAKPFINARFKVKKANPSDEIEKQYADAIVHNEHVDNFSAFEEELTGEPRMLRNKGSGFARAMTAAARGGDKSAKVKGTYRLNPTFTIPSLQASGLPVGQFVGMLSGDKGGRGGRGGQMSKQRTFILGGPEFPMGLYHISKTKSRLMARNSPK